jgi:hypothetical protein
MIITKAYREGFECYRKYGLDLSLCPYDKGTEDYSDFERGMIQGHKRNPCIGMIHEQRKDRWQQEEEAMQKIENEKAAKKLEKDRLKNIRDYRRATEGE